MNQSEFIALIKQPENVNATHFSDLKSLVEQYPYFVSARLLLLKLLQQNNDVLYPAFYQLGFLYTNQPRKLYYYLHPDRMLSSQAYKTEKSNHTGGGYFDLLSAAESGGGDTKTTLKNMAEKLKSARAMVVGEKLERKITGVSTAPNISTKNETDQSVKRAEASKLNSQRVHLNEKITVDDYFAKPLLVASEYQAKKLISERKYTEAIEILKQLNLNNPKKSVYFADQIRFLEKVIVNSKK